MNFEIEILSKDYVSLDSVVAFLNENAIKSTICRVQVIDSWEWDNIRVLDNLNQILTELKKGKKIVGNLRLLPNMEVGVYVECKESLFNYSFWFDSRQVDIKKDKRGLYNDICLLVDKSLDWVSYGLVVCAIGEEMLFSFLGDMEQTEKKSSGVEVYIFPLDSKKKMGINSAYTKKTYSNIYAFQAIDMV